MSCRKLKKAGCGEYGDAKANSYMLIDSAVAAAQTKTATGGSSKRSCKSKGGNESLTNALNAVTNAINNMNQQSTSTVPTTGGSRRGRCVKAGTGLTDMLSNPLANLNTAIAQVSAAASGTPTASTAVPAVGGGGCSSCKGGVQKQKKGGNVIDLAPFAVALSLIGVRMLKDKQFMNSVDNVINDASSSKKSASRSSRSARLD